MLFHIACHHTSFLPPGYVYFSIGSATWDVDFYPETNVWKVSIVLAIHLTSSG